MKAFFALLLIFSGNAAAQLCNAAPLQAASEILMTFDLDKGCNVLVTLHNARTAAKIGTISDPNCNRDNWTLTDTRGNTLVRVEWYSHAYQLFDCNGLNFADIGASRTRINGIDTTVDYLIKDPSNHFWGYVLENEESKD